MKILHVDDHQLFTEGLASALHHSSLNCTVITATNADQVLALLAQHNDIDLLLIDLGMPNVDGICLMEGIIQRNYNIPMAVLSAQDDPWQIKDAFNLGATAFLPKSWGISDIVEALTKIEQGEIVLPDYMAQAISKLPEEKPKSHSQKAASSLAISPRQLEVLKLMQLGHSNKKIADILFISETTVKSHVQVLFQSIGAANRIECVRFAQTLGLLEQDSRQQIPPHRS